jgi:hypothetical protein
MEDYQEPFNPQDLLCKILGPRSVPSRIAVSKCLHLTVLTVRKLVLLCHAEFPEGLGLCLVLHESKQYRP